MTTSVLKEVAALPGLSTGDLKAKWRVLFDDDPPPYNKSFLVRRLAYRLQELAHGGLSETTRERLKKLANEEGTPPRQQGKRLANPRLPRQNFFCHAFPWNSSRPGGTPWTSVEILGSV